MIWEFKHKNETFNNINRLCGNITDAVIKYSLKKSSVDNVTVIFICFQNFKEKMEDADFEYGNNIECKFIEDELDLNK